MRTALLLGLLVLVSRHAHSQPADCVADQPATASMPLSLNLQGLPGVPRALQGQVDADVPVAPPGGTVCGSRPPPPSHDVLAGPPGDVLHGPPVRDLLRGPVPRVTVDSLPAR